MGSFDVDADGTKSQHLPHPYIPEDPIFTEIRETKINDNRFAWRLNCEDGSAYGISPYDYDTKADYIQAIRCAKAKIEQDVKSEEAEGKSGTLCNSPDNQYFYLRVSRLDNGINQYYLSKNHNIKIGDMVTVPTEDGTTEAIVIAAGWYSAANAPQPPDDTNWTS